MTQNYFLTFAFLTTLGLLARWRLEMIFHQRRLRQKKYRVHVNGIRGKSTVTRLLAAVLRESGSATVAKTTGSAACVIDQNGMDVPIQRNGSPTILEQIEIIKQIPNQVESLVIECMAIKPEYQEICERMIVQSNIGVITNIREDHQDVLGETLEEIAANLLTTCPRDGVLITAEQNPDLLPLFKNVTQARNCRLIVVDEDSVTDDEVAAFGYVAFKENIAIAFELARLIGVDRRTAFDAMVSAAPDPGVFEVVKTRLGGCQLVWADMFAVNDRQSVILGMKRLGSLCRSKPIRVGILNNRDDREDRALRFAKIASQDIDFDSLVLMGAYENRVEQELVNSGYAKDKIVRLGSHRNIPDSDLIPQIVNSIGDDRDILLVGLVNIHTRQADAVRSFFQNAKQEGGGQ